MEVKPQAQVVIQDKPFILSPIKQDSLRNSLTGNSHYRNLDTLEQDFFYWVNHLRWDPSSFGTEIVEPYLREFPEMESSSSKSLLSELSRLEKLPFLSPDAGLSAVAGKHALDLVQNSRPLSHTGSKNRNFQSRIREAGTVKCASENLYEGRDQALEALIILLIDHGVPGYGHRGAILNPNHTKMGCSVVQRPNNGLFIYVQVFSCQ